MPPYFPEQKPPSPDDVSTLRWSVRSDGERGFLFFNNHHRTAPWSARTGVQFALQFDSGTQLVPREPFDIPAGAYGFWPVHLDCAGVRLDYATAQLIARLEADGQHWFFFTASEGIVPEFAFADEKPCRSKPGPGIAFTRRSRNGAKVNFVVLSADQGCQFWKLPLAGRDRVVLSFHALLPDSEDQIRLETLALNRRGSPCFRHCPPSAGRVVGSEQRSEACLLYTGCRSQRCRGSASKRCRSRRRSCKA